MSNWGVPHFIVVSMYNITLPLLHLLLRVRLLWFVCARNRRFSQNPTVFAELDGFRRTRSIFNNNNNNKITSSAPKSELDQWRNKTKGLGILVIMYNAKSRQPMDGGSKKLRRIGNFEKIGFQITAK